MSDKTTPELEHKPIDPKHFEKPDEQDCEENETDHCDFVNEKEPLNKNNVKLSTPSLNNKNELNKDLLEGGEIRNSILRKKNSYKVNNVKNNNHENVSSKFTTTKIRQMEEDLRKRSGLSKKGFILAILLIFILFVLLITVIVLIILWPRNLHSQTSPICRSPSCLMSSAQMLPMLNASIPFCEDFREYSCGGWLKNNQVPSQHQHHYDMKTHLSYKRKQQVRDLLVTRIISSTDTTSVPWKMKTFYDTCMDGEHSYGDETRALESFLRDIGCGEIFAKFNAYAWEPKKPLIKIHSKLAATPFFKTDVVPDPKDALQNIIRISPAGLGLPDRNFYFKENEFSSPIIEAYKNNIKDMEQLLQMPRPYSKTFSADNIFNYEKRLAEVSPSPDVLKDGYHAYKIVSLEELGKSAPLVPLLDILGAKFPDAKINGFTKILVPESNYIQHVSMLISNTHGEALHSYLLWNVVREYFPFISQIFRDTSDVFTKALHGRVTALPRWEFCIDTLQEHMSLAVAALVQNAESDKPQAHHVVQQVFQSVKKTIVQSFKHASWIEPELLNFMLEKINNTSLQVGLPAPFTLDKYVTEYYESFYVYKSDFLRTINSAKTFPQLEYQKRLTTPSEESRWLDAIVSPDLSVSYVASANKVNVPWSLLSEPFFHPDYNLPVIYGHLGVELSHAILSSVSPWNILYGVDGALLDTEYPAVNASIRVVADTQPCIGRAIARSVQKPIDTVSNYTTNQVMTKISAVRQTFKALESELLLRPHIHQPAMETLEPNELYFVAYTQSVCSLASQEYNRWLDIQFVLSDAALLKTVYIQSKEFSDVFSCSSNSELFTEDSCPDVI